MKTVHIVAYFNETETVSENDAAQSMSKLSDHIRVESQLGITFETMPEAEDHEKNASEKDHDGNLMNGIRRPPPSKKELHGNRVSMSFSPNLSRSGTGGLRDFCIHIDCKFHIPTLAHEFIHAIGLDPDGRDKQIYAGKEIDDQTTHHKFWNRLHLKKAARNDYNIPPVA